MTSHSPAVVELDELISLRATARVLELGARRRSLSAQAGGYLSVYRGRGLEFDEVRAYQAGDDARTIDWRVTARRGKPHTKLFREERERPVVLLVDLHPGMYFGTRVQFKSVLAARTAALLGWSAQFAGDRVGGIVTGSGNEVILPPKSRRAGTLALLQALVRCQPRTHGEMVRGRLDSSLARLVRLVHPGSLVFVLSDFREMTDQGESCLATMVRHNDVMLGMTYDPLEAEPPPPGLYQLGTPARRLRLEAGAQAVDTAWRSAFETHMETMRSLCIRHGVHLMPLCTANDTLLELRHGLARHRRAA